MNRKEFLEKLGVGAAFALTATCLGSCSKDSAEEEKDVDFTIDLSNADFAALENNGDFVITENTVVARGIDGEYLAASVVCSHENLRQVTFDNQNNEWFCTAHGARYDLDGEGLNPNGAKGLAVYNTSLDGNMLRIFS